MSSVPPAAAHGRPSEEAYGEIQRAFDHFNQELFDGVLPAPLFTFQRKKRMQGYYSPERFLHKWDGLRVAELAMNPVYFALETAEQTMQTLVHEMVHLWQSVHGSPGRRKYHNREWADKMEAVGLMPSSTGRPGGRRTGERMSDYVIEGGLFEQSCARLLSQHFRISWVDRYPARARPNDGPADRVIEAGSDPDDEESGEGLALLDLADAETESQGKKKYQRKYRCAAHNLNVWGKPNLKVVCGECLKPLEEIPL